MPPVMYPTKFLIELFSLDSAVKEKQNLLLPNYEEKTAEGILMENR